MNRIRSCALAAAVTGLFLSAQSAAETATVAVPGPPAGAKGPSPNDVICEKQDATGSRLTKRRVCMTRAQWADLRLQDRQEIDKVQVRRGMSGQ